MSRDRHRQVEAIFQNLVDLPVEEREAALHNQCGDDETLRREVAALLEHYDAAQPEFLQEPVFARGASDEELPVSVGPYDVVGRLGEGGMGVVYEGEQEHPKRRIAVKVLRAGLYSKSQLSRFRAEWDALGRLNHPGIANVYGAGMGDVVFAGRSSVELPYLAMELVKGRNLVEHVEHNQLDRESRMELLAQVCDAVHYAHEQSVIHRDLKPSNIVVDASERPKILDFGVARITDQERTKNTRTGDVIGTVRYMSPEQLFGNRDVDARSDIYSLGVILYELLTGESPYGESDTSITSRILWHERGSVPRIAKHDPTLRGDIDAIIRMAMETDPARRYQSAADLADDIRRHLGGQPVRAPAENRWDAWRRFARRRRGAIAVAASAVIVAGAIAMPFVGPFRARVTPAQGIATGDRLAVMYFENLAEPDDPERRGEIITELLISGLSQSERLNVVSSQRLYDLLKLVDAGVKRIDRATATQLARRANAGWMMHGSILQSEPNLVVKSDIVNVATGDVAASLRTAGSSGESVFSIVDRMARETLSIFALPQEETKAAAVSTRSEEAYRYYIEGKTYWRKQFVAEALESYRKAVAIDSTFAMAAFELANLLVERGDPTARDLYALAKRHAQDTSWRDQQYISEGFGWSAVRRAARSVLQRYPRDTDALWQLAVFSSAPKERITYGTRLIEIDPGHEAAYCALAYAYSEDRNLDKALWACDQYEALAPEEPNVFDSRGEIYAQWGRLDDAIAQYSRAASIKPDLYNAVRSLGRLYMYKGDFDRAEAQFSRLLGARDPLRRARGRQSLVELRAYRGQIERALLENEAAISVDRMDALDFRQSEEERLQLAAILLAEVGETEAALEKLTASYAHENTTGVGTLIRIISLARIGARDVARQYWQQFDAWTAEQGGIPSECSGWLDAAKGHYEIMMKNHAKAVEYLEKAPGYSSNRFALARSYVEMKRWDDAIRVLEPLSTDYTGPPESPVDAARLYYYLGVTYHELGRDEAAIPQLEKFLSIWENADPRLDGPEDARRLLVALRSGD